MECTRILKNNFYRSINWSRRNKLSGGFKLLKKRILRYLNAISGNELAEMLIDVLAKSTMRKVQEKYVLALSNLSTAINDAKLVKQKIKHNFIRPIRNSGLSLKEIREMGFECGKKLWKSCLNSNERNLGGRSKLQKPFIDKIKEHMEGLSNFSSNRTIRVPIFAERDMRNIYKKTKVDEFFETIRYRQTTLKEAYRKFIESNNHQDSNEMKKIAFSTFHKYIDTRFKKPTRATDLCHYCEMSKSLEKEVKNTLNSSEIKLEFKNVKKDFCPTTLLHCIKANLKKRKTENAQFSYSHDMKLLIEKINVLKSVDYHKNTAERQRRVYNQQRSDLKLFEDSILIDIDYKQRFILGEGPRQLNSEFYQAGKKGVLILGFGIYYLDKSTGYDFINCINLDIISDYEKQGSFDLIRSFKYMMTLQIFREVDKDNYVIWTDCGTNFRSAEFIFFLFNDLAEKGKCVNLNFFCEKHGKNSRDMHFSVISRALKNAAFKGQTSMKSAEDVFNALNHSFIYKNCDKMRSVKIRLDNSKKKRELKKKSNNSSLDVSQLEKFITPKILENANKNLEKIEKMPVENFLKSFAVLFNPPLKETVKIGYREIDRLYSYYNFRNIRGEKEGEYEFFSTLFSDLNKLIPIDSKINVHDNFVMNINYQPAENRIINASFEEYNLMVERNISAKRIFIDYLMKSVEINERNNLTDENYLSSNSHQEEQRNQTAEPNDVSVNQNQSERSLNATLDNNSQSEHLLPPYCIYNCSRCTIEPFYSIEDIKKSQLINHHLIKEELFKHSHKKNLQIQKKPRTVLQAKAELLAHYKYSHNYY